MKWTKLSSRALAEEGLDRRLLAGILAGFHQYPKFEFKTYLKTYVHELLWQQPRDNIASPIPFPKAMLGWMDQALILWWGRSPLGSWMGVGRGRWRRRLNHFQVVGNWKWNFHAQDCKSHFSNKGGDFLFLDILIFFNIALGSRMGVGGLPDARQKFEKNRLEAPRSCFVGVHVPWNCVHP